ncbi:hypothetical protein [Pseudonocardia sp. McavD-2-B]|uniref:hypothetical protein n=1 Tax=Pseudonocardia sp. McavD-2-B TaxID=2954499 RepID=UPI002096F3F0|nr:hypothetical protein [Pseudonocardia sp. McavD-2-B]MCO7195052.1 hypothetical protein [Pseudonocardia sp. McavD-2-B]
MSKTPKADASKAAVEALRDSGYRGPIDENGKATTHDEWCERHGIDPTTGRAK